MGRLVKDKFLICLLLLTVCFGYVMWLTMTSDRSEMSVSRGVLDLSGWDYDNNSLMSLDGEWEFYASRLLEPGSSEITEKARSYIQVPGKWDGLQDGEGGTMRGNGFGTYRLVIKNAPVGMSLAIAKNYARFADKLYIDGALVGESGETGVSKDRYTPRNVPYAAYFQSRSGELEVLLQVSNFDFKNGGITDSLVFGLGKEMQIQKTFLTGLEIMGTIVLLIFALINISLYIWFHRDSLLLLFGSFFLFFTVSIFTNGERLFLQLLPAVSFEVAFKIKVISTFMAPALLFYISWSLVRQSRIRILFFVYALILTVYCIGVVFLPFRIYSGIQDILYAGITFIYLVLVGYLLTSYVRERYGLLDKRQFQFYFAAAWSLLLLGINVILGNQIMTTRLLNYVAVLLFLIFISMLLIHQFVGTYTAMKKLTKQLQLADRMKDEFLLITSHELNTPLNGIMNVSRALLKEPFKKSSEKELKDKLQMIRNTAYRMSNMVNDIIDSVRIKDGKLPVERRAVDLATCVSVVMEVFGYMAKGKNTQLISRIDPEARYVYADEKRLMQVLYNALNFSLKHNQDGSVVIGSGRKGEMVGIRIHAENGLSGPAQRAPDAEAEETAETGGFSVGLSVAKELVELMEGTFIPSAEGVEVFMPAADHDGATEEIPANDDGEPQQPVLADLFESKSTAGKTAKILIASADPVDVEHLYGMLTTEGFEASCAGTNKEAYSRVTRMDRPDLVLLDVMLPDENGYELCRRIRDHFTQAELPILLISSRWTSAEIEAGIAAGGSDFVTRPLDPGEIRVRINTLLSMKRLVKEAAVNEMAFLRSQIKPHFLYNALGTIMSLCYTDGVRAGELLSIFSRYLRIIFHLDNTEETVKLSKEMELIQAYADIEQARFGDRVRFEVDVDKELYGCQVMPLTIEPLVENAIRHGVSKKLSGGTVKLTIKKDGEYVRVVVEDDGTGMTPEQVSAILDSGRREHGVGFRNIMRRVAHMTGKPPVVESEKGKGTTVTIWLPLVYSS
ncbi:ATP-binding protein [Paenibacillus contaminans]|uniref:histidine kinase n=1 Tax=Paenibacillus contaminans TaxID=450362 RepID=A0A329M6R2_9BACL|nr:ATP-binding protein [Paenibacillus contaminans]RAV14383.1 hypothetical protein DQG23_31295 [Paenibacillus contaminans]